MISKGQLRKLGDYIFTLNTPDNLRAKYEPTFALKLYDYSGVCPIKLSLAKWAKAEDLFNRGYVVWGLGDECGFCFKYNRCILCPVYDIYGWACKSMPMIKNDKILAAKACRKIYRDLRKLA
jgi:hypothetical protein